MKVKLLKRFRRIANEKYGMNLIDDRYFVGRRRDISDDEYIACAGNPPCYKFSIENFEHARKTLHKMRRQHIMCMIYEEREKERKEYVQNL